LRLIAYNTCRVIKLEFVILIWFLQGPIIPINAIGANIPILIVLSCIIILDIFAYIRI